MRIKAPAEKNFRRARAKPARRRKVRALFSWRVVRGLLIVTLVSFAGYRAASLTYYSSLFRVSKVRLHGNVRVSNGEVQVLLRELQGVNILTANLAESRTEAAELAVARRGRSAASAAVDHRRVRLRATALRLVPAGESALPRLPRRRRPGRVRARVRRVRSADCRRPHPAAHPVPGVARGAIDGAAPQKVDPARAALAARVVDAIHGSRELTARVSQIDVADVHNAVILLDNDPALLHVGEERFRERLQSYLEISEALRERIPNIDYVDLRFEQRVYVKPRGRAGGTALQLPAAGKTF